MDSLIGYDLAAGVRVQCRPQGPRLTPPGRESYYVCHKEEMMKKLAVAVRE